MKLTNWELQGGLKFAIETPESVNDYNQLAGTRPADANSTGVAVLDDAIDNTMYRGPFADVRYALAIRLEAEYPDVPRNRKDKPGAKPDVEGKIEQVFDESEGKYISRVAAVKGVAVTTFQSILDDIMSKNTALPADSKDKIKFDPSQRERRGPSSTEPGKGDIETAKALLGASAKKLRVAITRLAQAIGTPVELVDSSVPDADAKNLRTVAMAVKAYNAWLKTQTQSALLA